MFSLLQSVLGYLLLPVGAVILGGIVATFRMPSPRLQSAIQHFAAGVVFSAVAVELLPTELEEHMPLPLIAGFAAGVIFMLLVEQLIKRLSRKSEGSEEAQGTGSIQATQMPVGLLAAVAVDLLIDGLLIGVGFAAGAKQGLLITIALTLEVLFVGLSVATEFLESGAQRGQVIAIVSALGALLALGAVIGLTLLGGLSGIWLAIVLAFGAAALLYLVTEELLVEAHETPDTPWVTATFFAGFLLLLVVDMVA